LKGWKWKEIN